MSDAKKCIYCGKEQKSIMQCNSCKIYFCGHCTAPIISDSQQDIPDIKNRRCPECNSTDISNLHEFL